MIPPVRLIHAALCTSVFLGLVSCSSSPGTFITYTQKKKTPVGKVFNVQFDAKPSDALAFNYANSVASIFHSRATGGRYTREASDTALAGLAAFGGAVDTLQISTHTVGIMGLSGLGINKMRELFDAKARATAYFEASRRIQMAIKDFRSYNLNNVSESDLSPNGWTLANVTQANIDIVEMLLSGRLPTPEDLEQASEQMTPEGASPQKLGDLPANNRAAPSLTSTERRPSAAEARLMAQTLELAKAKNISSDEIAALKARLKQMEADQISVENFAMNLKAVFDLVKTEGDQKQNETWSGIVSDAGLTGKITGTGAGGQIKSEDIQAYYEQKATDDEKKTLLEKVKMRNVKE